jgi:hypothetical protein
MTALLLGRLKAAGASLSVRNGDMRTVAVHADGSAGAATYRPSAETPCISMTGPMRTVRTQFAPRVRSRRTGREHRVPLASRCVEILRRPKELSAGSDFVFPGRSHGKPLVEYGLPHGFATDGPRCHRARLSARHFATGRRNARTFPTTSVRWHSPIRSEIRPKRLTDAAISWRDGFPSWKTGRLTCLHSRRTAPYLGNNRGRLFQDVVDAKEQKKSERIAHGFGSHVN